MGTPLFSSLPASLLHHPTQGSEIEEIKNSYDKFAKWVYKQLIGGNIKYFNALLSSEDFFTRFLKITLRPFRVFYRCSAAINSFAVDSRENILICPAFIGNRNGILGNLNSGFDEKKKRKFENFYADKIKYCKNTPNKLKLRLINYLCAELFIFKFLITYKPL